MPVRKQKLKSVPKKNFCFGCGKDNATGMRLKFAPDESGEGLVCHFQLGKRYTGPPAHCHGGIIATILDEAMAKLNRFIETPAATSKMTVEYLRPVPLNQPLEVWSQSVARRGRRLTRSAEIVDRKGRVLARARGVFVVLGAKHVFSKK